ncbi:MAG: glycine cleavage system aminomethyltransferase GcvT, partial [Deltaproteobacteria bacterium]|nr:glycine cleavage system aminomethyltransferase GcvT [Deltaproteobacteria bacterium]
NKMGMFDVSHMGELVVVGAQALEFLQYLTSNDVAAQKIGQCQYNLLMNEKGGVVDDLIVNRLGENEFFICVNASNIEKDFEWIKSHQSKFKVSVENQSEAFGQIAIQGPLAKTLINKKHCSLDAIEVKAFYFTKANLFGVPVTLARTGYTGEDGFEIYTPADQTSKIWSALLEEGKNSGLMPCGLGCRDTLRLEMAYPLYGHELNDEITPLEAGLGWVTKLQKGNFLGRDKLIEQKEKGISKKRVGFIMQEEAIARADYSVFNQEEKIGWVSSGTYSPSLDKKIGCAYADPNFSSIGTIFSIDIRGKKKKAEVVGTPFYRK